jgi:hypothetical protein
MNGIGPIEIAAGRKAHQTASETAKTISSCQIGKPFRSKAPPPCGRLWLAAMAYVLLCALRGSLCRTAASKTPAAVPSASSCEVPPAKVIKIAQTAGVCVVTKSRWRILRGFISRPSCARDWRRIAADPIWKSRAGCGFRLPLRKCARRCVVKSRVSSRWRLDVPAAWTCAVGMPWPTHNRVGDVLCIVG